VIFDLSDPAFLAACQPAGGFNPLSIPGCVLWLAADGDVYNTGTTQATDGQSISTWVDASGNSKDAVPYSAGGTFQTGEINSLPIIRLGGAGGFDVPAIGTNKTLFVVAKPTSTGGAYTALVVTDGISGTTSARIFSVINSAQWGTYTSTNCNSGTTLSNNVAYVLSHRSDTSRTFRTNGAADGSYASSSGDPKTATTIGTNVGGQYFTGDIAEIIAYDSVLSDADCEAVEDYLGAKWGITITH